MTLKIYIDRLRNGHVETLEEMLCPSLLDIQEKDLKFPEPIHLKAKVYLAEDHIVAQINLHTTALIPCNICNEDVHLPIEISGRTHTVPLSEIPSPIFSLDDLLREEILLTIPPYAECGGKGKCHERENLKTYLGSNKGTGHEEVQFPFQNL